ncbi:MAG: hypothetical protein ACTSSK_03435 [Candidatus Heimdallarchaeota archaeon]
MSNEQKIKEIQKEGLSEKNIADVLLHHLSNLCYQATTELVLNSKHLDIQGLTGKELEKVRIDVAAYKDEKISFIEIENGLWLTHPLLYRNFAHNTLLAYPAENTALTDEEQIEYAKLKGIGIVSVSTIGSVTSILRPKDQEISEQLTKAIISLIDKRISKQK